MKKVFLYIWLFCAGSLYAQHQDIAFPHTVPMTPEAASFATYADYPVSHYTGVPNINVPLYEIDIDGFKIPITLAYHASGIRVDQEATWVGLGWTLNVGSRISRTIKHVDDFMEYWDRYHPYCEKGWYDAPELTFSMDNYYRDQSVPCCEGWACFESVLIYDTEPDIFYYNLPAMSGKFILDKSRGAILFDKSHNLKINIIRGSNGMVTFTITDPDGNQYFYNDIEKTKHYAAEEALHKNNTTTPEVRYDERWTNFDDWVAFRVNCEEIEMQRAPADPYNATSSWCLSKIITKNGREIIFTYADDYQELPTQESCEQYNPSSGYGGGSFFYRSKVVNRGKRLTKIAGDFGYISFTSSKRYDIRQVDDKYSQRLDRIAIYDKNNNPVKSFRFNYSYFNLDSEVSRYAHVFRRLKLNNVTEYSANQVALNGGYNFKYYEGTFPAKNSKNVDYWGFQNGKNYGSKYYIGIFFAGKAYGGVAKNADFNKAVIGTLKEIVYPEGGKTEFQYESNTFPGSYFATHVPGESFADPGKGAGIRIKQITNNAKIRKFNYPEGTILVEPTLYYFGNRSGTGNSNECIVQISESKTPLTTFNNGNFVGYDWVEEYLTDGSDSIRTKYYFYNTPEEFFDDNPAKAPSPVIINYRNGLTRRIEHYSNATLVQETDYNYESTYGNKVLAVINKREIYNPMDMLFYTYDVEYPLKASETTALIDRRGNKIVSETDYTYNSRDLPQTSTQGVNGSIFKEKYNYPFDFDDQTSRKMVEKNRISTPVETIRLRDDKVISGRKIGYKDTLGLLLPGVVSMIRADIPIPETEHRDLYQPELRYERYDKYGNVLQQRGIDGLAVSFLWDTTGLYKLAEVVDATYDEVQEAAAGMNLSVTAPDATYLQSLRDLREKLPQALITNYTHKPLVGVTSETDPNGITTYYEYDDFGRLKTVRDYEGNVLKEHEYRYHNE